MAADVYPHQRDYFDNNGGARSPEVREKFARLNESHPLLWQYFSKAGYRTYHSGKWHVGGFWNSGRGRGNPIERGFDHAFCCNDGNAFAPRSIHCDQQAVELWDGFYSTDVVSDYAVRMVEEHGKEHPAQPFFLHFCYTVPHSILADKDMKRASFRRCSHQPGKVKRRLSELLEVPQF